MPTSEHGQKKALEYPEAQIPISGCDGKLFTIKLMPNELYSITDNIAILQPTLDEMPMKQGLYIVAVGTEVEEVMIKYHDIKQWLDTTDGIKPPLYLMCIVCELQCYATVCMFCCVKNDIFFANGTKSCLPLHSQTGRDPLENSEEKFF